MRLRLLCVALLCTACRLEDRAPAAPPTPPRCEGKLAAVPVDTSYVVVNGVRYIVLRPRCQVIAP